MLVSHSRTVDSGGNYRQLAAIPRINSDMPQHRAVASIETLLKAAAAVMARDFPKVATHKLCHSQLKVLQSGWWRATCFRSTTGKGRTRTNWRREMCRKKGSLAFLLLLPVEVLWASPKKSRMTLLMSARGELGQFNRGRCMLASIRPAVLHRFMIPRARANWHPPGLQRSLLPELLLLLLKRQPSMGKEAILPWGRPAFLVQMILYRCRHQPAAQLEEWRLIKPLFRQPPKDSGSIRMEDIGKATSRHPRQAWPRPIWVMGALFQCPANKMLMRTTKHPGTAIRRPRQLMASLPPGTVTQKPLANATPQPELTTSPLALGDMPSDGSKHLMTRRRRATGNHSRPTQHLLIRVSLPGSRSRVFIQRPNWWGLGQLGDQQVSIWWLFAVLYSCLVSNVSYLPDRCSRRPWIKDCEIKRLNRHCLGIQYIIPVILLCQSLYAWCPLVCKKEYYKMTWRGHELTAGHPFQDLVQYIAVCLWTSTWKDLKRQSVDLTCQFNVDVLLKFGSRLDSKNWPW